MPEIDLPRHLDAVALACEATEQALQSARWADADITRVSLATAEAVSNAIEHGPHRLDPITFQVAVTSDHAELRFDDGGAGPAPERIATANLPADPLALGGRGLYILGQLADSIRVQKGVLVLTFRPRL